MAMSAALGCERVKRWCFVTGSDDNATWRGSGGRHFVQVTRHAGTVDHAFETVGAEMLAQIRRLRHRTDNPIAGDFFL